MGHAARKSGITSVPMNYRLSPEEAAYVTDNSDALLIWTDAEYAELFRSIRKQTPKVREIVVFGGEAPEGTIAAEDWLRGVSEVEPVPPPFEARTMIYTSGTTGKPKGAVRTGQGNPEQLAALLAHVGYKPDDIYLTTGPLYHSGPGGFMGIAFLLGQHHGHPAQVRPRGLAARAREAPRHHHLLGADADPAHREPARRRSRTSTTARLRAS